MIIYLVDYENVGVSGLNGLSKLDSNAKLVIFYSDNADKLTFGLHRRLCESAARGACIEYMRADVSSGKNALDFQLALYAGISLKELENSYIFIVSKDKGYDCLQKIVAKYSSKLERVDDLTNYSKLFLNPNTNLMETITDNSETSLDKLSKVIFDYISELDLCGFDAKELSMNIAKIYNTYKSKVSINSNIQKLVKNNVLHQNICKAIKPLLKEKT